MGQVDNVVSEIDYDAMPTLGDIPRHYARTRPGKIASVYEGRETDWAELDRRSNRVAHALIAAGVSKGERVAFAGKGSDEFFELYFGVAKAGAVMVPTIWRLAAPEIAHIATDSEVRLLFVAPDQFERLETFKGLLPQVRMITLEDGAAGYERFADWREAGDDSDPAIAVEPSEVCLQLYTSGTTGLPKGVMLSHYNILGSREIAEDADMDWARWEADDVNLVAMPLGHVGGVGAAAMGYLNGVRNIIQPEFVPDKVLEALAAGVNRLFLVPTALHMLLLHPRVREVDYSRLRYILYGASPIALELLKEATEVFGCGFCQQYGATETSGTIAYLPPQDHDPQGNKRMRGAGKPMPRIKLRIVDAERNVLPANTVGEIQVLSGSTMAGYWKREAATAEAVSADGWFSTGDAGYLDEDGYLYIADRFSDMICSGAENIYPNEVENAIYGHPAVLEVAVIGVPDAKWGETVKAVVVLKPGAEASEEDIIAHARERIGGFKLPKSVDFMAALPRNATGKVLRRTLREPYWGERERKVN
ncbi:fatty acid--CoA ligase [Brevundimonas terrae]|uniref:Fatty acid--CoA ligase n=1 Tax=Brevundimonas terrae TaxID=363631 RepID=A0ABP3HZF0_9CAUL|nr:fatty acid--CoA ligase [Brevundimonas terrae]NIJ25466.1 long-chain acyl-CoA synthetase [Brevundimonas terrae]